MTFGVLLSRSPPYRSRLQFQSLLQLWGPGCRPIGKLINTIRSVCLKWQKIASFYSFLAWLSVHIFKLNLMKRAGWMMPAYIHRHTSVTQLSFCALTSKAPDNLRWLAFHKTKITWSSYIICWLIASVRTSQIMNVYYSYTVKRMTLTVQKTTKTTCSFKSFSNQSNEHTFAPQVEATLSSPYQRAVLLSPANSYLRCG